MSHRGGSGRAVRLLLGIVVCGTLVPRPVHALANGRPAAVRVPGHVLSVLRTAETVPPAPENEPLTLTIVLARDDQAGFERFARAVADPGSPLHRHFLSQRELADRFGPSQRTYDRVLRWLRAHGFTLVAGSANRLTLTVRAARADVERALDVRIGAYRLGNRTFHATNADPALPPDLARGVQAIAGLSDLATPRPQRKIIVLSLFVACYLESLVDRANAPTYQGELLACLTDLKNLLPYLDPLGDFGFSFLASRAATAPPPWTAIDGTGQKIGLLEFDTFDPADVADYLSLLGYPASLASRLSQVHVHGGAPAGPDQDEVLLDIEAALTIAPGASTVVYDAPFTGAGTSFQTLFNAMIDDGVTVISNSWAYCEDQTTAADVMSIDAILASAGASGISVFNAAGDTGSRCLDGSADTVAVPADSPNATAVGGSSLTTGPGLTYVSETWWDGSDDTPPTGQGGFGQSKFFPRPSYQDALSSAPMRSVPDVVSNADPARGVILCQASAGGCPNGLMYGGTSLSAPTWAAFTALLNQAHGQNLGALNPLLYPLAGTGAFHSAASMGSDFAHVGLGSPNVNLLHLALSGQSAGAPSAAASRVSFSRLAATGPAGATPRSVEADGTSEGFVVVQLRDASGNMVAGKTVSLAASPGSDATITPTSGVSSAQDGTVVFTVKNATAETVSFTATDTSDGIVLMQTVDVPFAVPTATQAGLNAFPTTVTADGVASTTITVTLKDSLDRGTPGKLVTLSQGNGHSIVTGPNPSVTDANGQIQFVATDQVNEVVTYSATDVSDGDLPVPQTAQVTFNNGAGTACGNGVTTPTAAVGFELVPWANGFVAGSLSFGSVNFNGCSGVLPPAFRGDDAFVLNFLNGDVFRLGAGGGAASSADKLGTVGPTLGWPVVGKDGRVYATRVATTGDFTTGAVLELDPDTGAVLRQVASNLKCPQGLALDPLSGDLFVDGECFGAGSDDPAIHRIRNPASPTPTVEVYATLPTTPNGNLAFAPNGSLYVVSGYTNPNALVVRVSGTNGPATPTVTPLTGVPSLYWVNVGEVDANGEARSLITLSADGKDLRLTDITANPPTSTSIAHDIGGGTTGPDGCLYAAANGITIFKLGDADGGCRFGATSANPALTLGPTAVQPNPAQGTERTFTATLHAVPAPAGTPVVFQVTGANPRAQMVRADAAGRAALAYTAEHAGQDAIVATATVGATTLTSNRAHVTWDPGKHTAFLTLNPSATVGSPGVPVAVAASLTDVSASAAMPVPSATVTFAVGAAQCSASTDAGGVASCALTPADLGMVPLTADFAGTASLLPASDSVGFTAACPAGLDGVTCYLDAFQRALDAASATDVKKSVRKQLGKKLKGLRKLVTKAQQPGKRGGKALGKLRRKLAVLAKRTGSQPDKKIAPALRDTLVGIAVSAQGAILE